MICILPTSDSPSEPGETNKLKTQMTQQTTCFMKVAVLTKIPVVPEY